MTSLGVVKVKVLKHNLQTENMKYGHIPIYFTTYLIQNQFRIKIAFINKKLKLQRIEIS